MMYLFLDSETAETSVADGQLDVTNGQVYDLGLIVMDEKGNVYTQISMVNEDVFFRMPDSMQSAYYANKMPQYLHEMRMGTRKIVNTWQMYTIVRDLCKQYTVDAIVAHNAFFDVNVLNSTIRYQTKSQRRWFLPWGVEIIDTLKMARDTFGKDDVYINWCKENGYMTKHSSPRPRLTAEILYRYITGNQDFEESHTGLEDVYIEKEIFMECLKRFGM